MLGAYLDAYVLLDAHLLIATGVRGVYGLSGVFEDVIERFDAYVTRMGADANARGHALSAAAHAAQLPARPTTSRRSRISWAPCTASPATTAPRSSWPRARRQARTGAAACRRRRSCSRRPPAIRSIRRPRERCRRRDALVDLRSYVLPPRAVRRSGAHADVPACTSTCASARRTQALAHRDRLARDAARRCCARSASTRSRSSPTIRSSAAAGAMHGGQAARAGAEVRAGRADQLGGEADRGRLVQLPPGSFRRSRSTSSTADGNDGAHRLRRLRPGAHRAGAVPAARLRPGQWPSATSATCSGYDADRSSHARSGDVPAPRHPRRGADLGGDELLRRSLDRAAARPRASSRWRRCPFTLAIDFEGDQWTFFKFPLADLYRPVRQSTCRSWPSGARSTRTSRSSSTAAGRCSWRSIRTTCPTPPARRTS